MANDDDIVSYKTKAFLETALKKHDRVESVEEIDHRRYAVRRKLGDKITLHVTGKYLFSEADYHDIKSKITGVDCILLGNPYASFTSGAQSAAAADGIATFKYKELFGALNVKDYRTYAKK